MAAPMREGAPAGGARPAPHTHPANFEYDDNEWDIGIGDLIIDLDADIEKTDEAGGMAARAEPDAQRTALKMKIKRTKPGTKSSEAKHEIVKSNETNGEPKPPLAPSNAIPIAAPVPAVKRGSGGHRRDKARDKHHHPHQPHEVNGVARTPSAPNAPGPPASANSLAPSPSQSASSKSEPRTPVPSASSRLETPKPATGSASATVPSQPAVPSGAAPTVPAPIPPPASPATKPEPDDSRQESATSQPPAKKVKLEPKETAEMCVGTSVGTITEPDCLGPCEPGTAVTLEGIVWHETEGGVLVVNVTWRGKTYVGTLLDCTRHDWAPPRFCDSPTEELDARTPKGRGAKRGRGAAPTDMTNFTETRSSVHSKLRNGGAKGRRALPSPTPFTPPRPDPKRKRTSEAEEQPPTPKAKRPPPTPTSPPPDPVLLECPEPNCSKKYKNAIGLKFHRSRAHGTPDDDDKDGSSSDTEETTIEPPSPARPPSEPAAPSTPSKSPVPTKSPIEDKDKSHEGSPEKTEEESPPTPRFEETPSANERPPSQPSTTPPTTPPANTQLPTQFKVKPRSALMPEEHKSESPTDENGKRRRRTPSPGVRSPAYSDISDDAAPPDGVPDDDTEHRPFNVYHQFYGQPSFIPSHPPAAVPPPPAEKNKDDSHKADPKTDLKESKPESVPQKPVLPQHFYPYNYVPNFPYNVEGNPPIEEKKDERSKTTPSPLDKNKQNKDIRPNDNHQILKESIEMKAQMSYPFQRPPHAREEDLRRFYMGERREPEGPLVNRAPPSKGPSKESKEIEIKPKAEGQKPTTETQGPPPPPTSQYYLPPFMSSPHFAALPFEPVYRVGPYATGWTPRFHAPEDLSRNNKDCLPHYAPHKIHELSEHAKGKPRPDAPQTPTPKERSPPPQRHVHTHHHTHVGLGYPLYPPPYPAAAVLASTQAVVNSFPTPPK